MNVRRIHLSIAAALGLAAAGICGASEVRTESAVRALLADQGYTEVTGLDLEGGMWIAEGRDTHGRPVMIKVEPSSARVLSTSRKVTISPAPVTEIVREVPVERTIVKEVPVERTVVREVAVPVAVLPAAPLTADGARSVLQQAGYYDVHDISKHGDVWKAEARDSTGDDREIHVDAMTGAIVHVEDD